MNKSRLFTLILAGLIACQNTVETQPTALISLATLPSTPVMATQLPTATQPTTIIPSPTSPVLLMDGKLRIAFISKGQVWFWKEGIQTALTKTGRNDVVRLSDDGNVVAYSSYSLEHPGFFDLWVYFIEDSTAKLLLDASTLQNMVSLGIESPNARFEWIPDSHNILLNDAITGRAYILNADSSEITQIQSISNPGFLHISPNGKILLLVTRTEIFTIDLEKDQIRKLLNYEEIALGGESPYPIKPVWSEDSTSFVIAIPPANVNASPAPSTIWNIDTNGSATILSQYSTSRQNSYISPDQSRVAYLQNSIPDYGFPNELHLLNLTDGKDVLVKKGNIEIVARSPDSTKLIFSEIRNGITEYVLCDIYQDSFNIRKLESGLTFFSWIDNHTFFSLKFQIGDINGQSVDVIEGERISSFDFVLAP